MSLSVTIRAQRLVQAPPQRVWAALCQASGLDPRRPLESEPLHLRPMGLPVRVRISVVASRPGEHLAWRGKWLGVSGRQSLWLEAGDRDATLLRAEEELNGWMLLPLRLLYSPARLGRAMQGHLAALAALAEAGN